MEIGIKMRIDLSVKALPFNKILPISLKNKILFQRLCNWKAGSNLGLRKQIL